MNHDKYRGFTYTIVVITSLVVLANLLYLDFELNHLHDALTSLRP